MALFKRLIAIFLLLWLPVNPAVALVMPFCPQSMGIVTHEPHQGADHEHAAQPPEHGDVFDKAGKYSCASFTLCHLAGASVIASFSEALLAHLKGNYHPLNVPGFIQFIPEQPERPPKSVSALA